MDREPDPIYAFGPYRLDAARRTLTHSNGEAVELKPRAFDLLRYLVEHAGELVEKKALLAAVWSGVVVEEHNLNKSISVLRRALGDGPGAHEYIATIPGRGYQFVRDVRSIPARSSGAHELPGVGSAAPGPRSRLSALVRLGATLAAAAGLASVAALYWRGAASDSFPAPTYALLDVRPADRLYGSNASLRPSRTAIRLSPDGRTLVFTGVRAGVPQLYKRRLQEAHATAIPGTERAVAPFFSPDGQWLAFWQQGRLKRSPLSGGPAIDIGAADGGQEVGPTSGSWGSTGLIVYSMPRGGIFGIAADGGAPQPVTRTEFGANVHHRLPYLLPDGRSLLFTSIDQRSDPPLPRLVLHRLDTGEQRPLLDDAADARYLSSGYVLFMRRGTLMAVPFDLERGELSGAAVAVADDVMQAFNQPNGLDETYAGQYDVGGGNLVFLTGGTHPLPEHQLVWVSRSGDETPFDLAPAPIYTPRWSPNGKLVAYTKAGVGPVRDIWVYDVDRKTARPVTSDGGGVWPLWSRDGTRLISARPGFGLRWLSADGYGPPSLLSGTADLRAVPSAWADSSLLTVELGNGPNSEIWSIGLEASTHATPLLQRAYFVQAPAMSPDGRWLAYVSWEAGSPDVYAQRYPQGESIRLSMTGGRDPRWTRDGREIVFIRPTHDGLVQVLATNVDTSDGIRFEPSRVLFEGRYSQTVPAHGYDVSPDGQTFVMVKPVASEPVVTSLNLVLDWESELANRFLSNP